MTVDRLRQENGNLYLKHEVGREGGRDLTLSDLTLTGWTNNKCEEEVELSRLSVSNDPAPLCSTLEEQKESIIKVFSVFSFPKEWLWWV